ncbi:doublesex- and mab-3-related transcription factor A1 [Exaiptasia diaphana]|uniref:DM domain-containing protein n=1 Tax=Exaiptasia diaphana TaxID=2652724 RepID=A0A913WTM6_EXADI|nr:doublesex- and mab-3-related transcription factor A1 [Exaiptasia diaphana]KXJ17996.1 Doublesex- and mab-3-related transcription factor A1 [Exaiptasia diaphana]
MSGRKCGKCRLHGKITLLKGHKRNCPFENCSCNKCASHENLLALRVQTRHNAEDKGKLWRMNLQTSLEAKKSAISFPEMTTNSSQSIEDDASFALQLANYGTARHVSENSIPKSQQRKAKSQKQLEKHRELFNSINSYSREIAAESDNLNPVTILIKPPMATQLEDLLCKRIKNDTMNQMIIT